MPHRAIAGLSMSGGRALFNRRVALMPELPLLFRA